MFNTSYAIYNEGVFWRLYETLEAAEVARGLEPLPERLTIVPVQFERPLDPEPWHHRRERTRAHVRDTHDPLWEFAPRHGFSRVEGDYGVAGGIDPKPYRSVVPEGYTIKGRVRWAPGERGYSNGTLEFAPREGFIQDEAAYAV